MIIPATSYWDGSSPLPSFDGVDLARELMNQALGNAGFMRDEQWLLDLLTKAVMTGYSIGYSKAELDNRRR